MINILNKKGGVMIFSEITIESLKREYTLSEAVNEINLKLPNILSINNSISWEDIESNLETLKVIDQLFSKKNDHYFISREAESIYYLVELDGNCQQEKLGIKLAYYKDKKKAKEWRDRLASQIYPDRCHHVKATEAMEKINELYDGMKKNAR